MQISATRLHKHNFCWNSLNYAKVMLLMVIFLNSFIISQCSIGLTRTSFYEEDESFSVASKDDQIPENLLDCFHFDGSTLTVKTFEGRSIGFVVARKDPDDVLLVEWCSPSPDAFNNCVDE